MSYPPDEYDKLMATKDADEYAKGDEVLKEVIEKFLLHKLDEKHNKPQDLRKQAKNKADYLLWLSDKMTDSPECMYAHTYKSVS